MKRRKQTYRLRRRKYVLGSIAPPEAAHAPPPPQRPADPRDTAVRREMAQLQHLAASAQQELLSRDAAIKRLKAELAGKDDLVRKKSDAFEEARRVVEQAKAQVQRSRQEMNQLRKRTERDKEDVRRYASEELLRQLFPVLDNFTVAVEALEQGGDPADLVRGIVMIHRGIMEVLQEKGFAEIKALGEKFDPQLHEAMSTSHDPSMPEHVVLKVLRHGYTLGDKVLRPAMVEVNKPPETKPASAEGRSVVPVEANPPEPSGAKDEDARAREEQSKSDSKITPLERARRILDQKTNFPE